MSFKLRLIYTLILVHFVRRVIFLKLCLHSTNIIYKEQVMFFLLDFYLLIFDNIIGSKLISEFYFNKYMELY